MERIVFAIAIEAFSGCVAFWRCWIWGLRILAWVPNAAVKYAATHRARQLARGNQMRVQRKQITRRSERRRAIAVGRNRQPLRGNIFACHGAFLLSREEVRSGGATLCVLLLQCRGKDDWVSDSDVCLPTRFSAHRGAATRCFYPDAAGGFGERGFTQRI